MQVLTSIRNKQFVNSFADVNARLHSAAAAKRNVGERYAMVDTATVIDRVLKIAITKGLHVASTRVITRGKSSKHVVRMRFTALAGEGQDTGHPELLFINSYNGECALSFSLGFYRLICSNGLTVPMPGFEDASFTSGRKRHIIGPKMDDFSKHLDERISAALDALSSVTGKFAALQKLAVTKEQERLIIDQLGLTKGQQKQFEGIRGGMYNRDTEHNLWSLFNAVNEAIRRSQRSDFSTELRNVNLLSTITEAYQHAQVA